LSQPAHPLGDGYSLIRVLRTWPVRPILLALLLALALAAPALAQAGVGSALTKQMKAAGHYSGAVVVDNTTGRTLFAWKPNTPRVLASNTKLFTTATALARFGSDGTFSTDVVSDTPVGPDGVLKGDLWLRGGGDPAFGTLSYVRKHYGPQAGSVEYLVDALATAGLTAVRGGVHGDESSFDTVRGLHDSGYGTSPWVGPLSALSFNHAYDGSHFQSSPPSFAADVLRKTLKADSISPGHAAATSRAPAGAKVLASVSSPPMSTLVQLTNKESDNFFAEMLMKDIGHAASGFGTTAAGVKAVRSFAAAAGATVQLIDGSGLDHGDRASPRSVVKLLVSETKRPEFPALYDSLPIAGVDGTIYDRMRSGPAKSNCRAKTGSLIGVSALSGFCTTRAGHQVAFSFLMNGLSTTYARRLQDKMAQAIAGSSN
jgi:D-alanyl-D-alanine carboxypeptidase/D-alanyl-D-alanine-endopeptidase (penicillin-binding protein 4)